MSCYGIRRFAGRTLIVVGLVALGAFGEFVAIVAAAKYLA